MKKIILTVLGTLAVTILMSSCKKDEMFENLDNKKLTSFVKETQVGIYEGYEKLYTLNEQTTQVTFTEDNKLYFMGRSDQSEYVKIEFSATPVLGQELTAEVNSVGLETIPNGSYKVKVEKIEGQTIWFWDYDKLLGFLLEY